MNDNWALNIQYIKVWKSKVQREHKNEEKLYHINYNDDLQFIESTFGIFEIQISTGRLYRENNEG